MQAMTAESQAIGLVCALAPELGSLAPLVRTRRRVSGVVLRELELSSGGHPVLACVCGVGKVRAAQAATALLGAGVGRALLVVGTCGGLVPRLGVGQLVHATAALQADLALRAERRFEADPQLLAAWSAVAPGVRGELLTADRPAIRPWRRLRLARLFPGGVAADMETAAVAAVASRAGVPWAALRSVTDALWHVRAGAFQRHFPEQAGRAADTVPGLLERMRGVRGEASEG